MIKRRKTKPVKVGSLTIGGDAPIVLQSMTKVHTKDAGLCIKQINQLVKAGCKLVRVAVPTRSDTQTLAKIIQKVSVPIVADIHFSPERAIEALEAGAAKIRLNPGNIKKTEDIHRIIDAAKMHSAAIRIGVNEASIRDLKKGDVPFSKRVKLMLDEMKGYVRLFEKRSFDKIVLSVKSSDTLRTIEINRLVSENFDYPIHLGLTHAGLPEDAQTPSAVSLGTLLAEGIGDTIRVSAAGNPVIETLIGKQILISLGLYPRSEPEFIVCPTCGRAEIDVVKLARRIKKSFSNIKKPIRIAIMGCIVNGPGEAADADLAVCAGKDKAFVYCKGKRTAIVPESKIIIALNAELKNI